MAETTTAVTAPATHLSEDLARHRALLNGRVPAFDLLFPLLESLASDPRFDTAWAGRRFSAFYDRPLLIFAALRDGALADAGHPLRDVLGDGPQSPAAGSPEALTDALRAAMELPGFWEDLARRHVQTNETSRAVAWLWAARILDWQAYTLVDLGCSAGLNLVADRLPYPWTEPGGAPLFPAGWTTRPGARLGLDARPLQVALDADRRWLRACVWPGETARITRLDAAIATFLEAPPPLRAVGMADAPAVLGGLSGPVLAVQTIVRDYLPMAARAAHEAAMLAWVSGGSERAWVELEYVEGGDPCGIVLHTRAGSRLLATCSYHPSVVAVVGGQPAPDAEG